VSLKNFKLIGQAYGLDKKYNYTDWFPMTLVTLLQLSIPQTSFSPQKKDREKDQETIFGNLGKAERRGKEGGTGEELATDSL
jgi:hypothetical protein